MLALSNNGCCPLDPLVQQGADTLAAVDLMTTSDPAQFDTNGHLYPSSGPARGFGRGLRETAQLIRADVDLRVAAVDFGGWDFHDAMGPVSDGTMRAKAQGLSDALTAFHDDLGPLMDEVTVAVMSEFGRTIGVNGSGGTDHGRGGAMMIMSGHAVGGVHGDYPSGRHGTTQEVFPGYTHPGDLGVLAV